MRLSQFNSDALRQIYDTNPKPQTCEALAPHRMILRCCLSILLILSCLLILLTNSGFAQNELLREIIQTKVEQIRDYTPLKVGDATIASTSVLPGIYENSRFEPIWTNPDLIATYIRQVEEIKAHGLKPSDYHGPELSKFHRALRYDAYNPWLQSDHELLLTDSVIRLLYHLFYGKVDPVSLHTGWNFNRSLGQRDPVRIIGDAIKDGTIGQLVNSLKPTHAYYQRLQAALIRYQTISEQNGWTTISPGPTLRLGNRDKRIKQLRQRLAITDDLPQPQRLDSDLFDEAVQQAVQHFQQRQSLEPDGIVDRITLEELNLPVEERIDQIKANLERARWVLHDLPDRFVVIDICGYMAYIYNAGKLEWSARIQVGQPYRQTPTFKSAIKYFVLNPTWTIPPGVLAQDILPESYQNPLYFEAHAIQIYDQRGRSMNPETIDLHNYDTRSFKYRFIQAPGPTNPLGVIKFMLPNRHFIYLHDTIEKEAFDEKWRAFSSGCIRVENPLAFAKALLNDPTQWDQPKLLRLVSSGKTRTIHMPTPLPILLLYMTVNVDQEGKIHFLEDVYQRDRDIIEGLDQPFVFKALT